MQAVKIVILGFGTVGQGLWHLLQSQRQEIERKLGYGIEVAGILVRDINKQRPADVPPELFTDDFNAVLAIPDVKLVVELMGGIEPANAYIRRALQQGKQVVTANKALLAEHGVELNALAAAADCCLRYEAAVCGGIPIIHTLQSSLAVERITSLLGIVNGTSNFILSRMHSQQLSYAVALSQAQQLGYAEADPRFDVEGLDAQHKLCLLARIAFGVKVMPSDIQRVGISHITQADVQYAEEQGARLKLVATARRQGEQLELRVTPTLLAADHVLAQVDAANNAVLVVGEGVGELFWLGPGAGGLPTGSAVLGDVLAALQTDGGAAGNLQPASLLPPKLVNVTTQLADWYLRLQWSGPATLGYKLLAALQQAQVASSQQQRTIVAGENCLQLCLQGISEQQLRRIIIDVSNTCPTVDSIKTQLLPCMI